MANDLVIIEDSDDDYETLTRMLRTVGFSDGIVRFQDGEAALAYLRQLDTRPYADDRVPGLVVLDLNLPAMDGRQVLQELKADGQLRTIPVVIYTTSSNAADIAYCYEHHANAYHVKPMDLGLLEAQVKALFDYWARHVVRASAPPS